MTQPIKILACDDQQEILELYSEVLRFPEFRVLGIRKSEEIVPAIEDFQPDKILLDLRMPLLHGEDILMTLKASPFMAKIPVIVCSADFHGQEIADKHGAEHFLMKPFDVNELRAILKN